MKSRLSAGQKSTQKMLHINGTLYRIKENRESPKATWSKLKAANVPSKADLFLQRAKEITPPKRQWHDAKVGISRREEVARKTFMALDVDGSGGLSQAEFKAILTKVAPEIDDAGVEKAFKKAKAVDTMDMEAFVRWTDKSFAKADDDTFEGLLNAFSTPVLS